MSSVALKVSGCLIFCISLMGGWAWADNPIHEYEIDPAHTSVVFKISHLDFSYTYGMFPAVSGNFKIDEKNPENSSLSIVIKTESVHTHNEKRDEHLRGPDFFNVKKHPEITFKSTKVSLKSKDTYEIQGQLSLNGRTRPLTVQFTRMKTGKDPWGKERTGGYTTFKIDRTQHNMRYMSKPGELGHEVEMFVSVEGIKKS